MPAITVRLMGCHLKAGVIKCAMPQQPQRGLFTGVLSEVA